MFHTENTDDIINVASAVVPMFGYFQNAGETLRQGVEAKIDLPLGPLDRVCQLHLRRRHLPELPDLAVAEQSGRRRPPATSASCPATTSRRFRRTASRPAPNTQITDAWKLGADLNVVGSQYLIHDDANQNPKVPAYWVVNLHTSYQLTKNVELFGLVQNLFNQHYYSAGTFVSTAGFTSNTPGAANFWSLNDPRTFLPGMPLAIYGGMKVQFAPASLRAQGSFNMARLPLKAPAAAPVYRWAGSYIGANGGWLGSTGHSIGNTGTDDGGAALGTGLATGAIPTSVGLGYRGFLLGGTVGYNWQASPMWLLGIETDFDGAIARSSANIGAVIGPMGVPQDTTFSRASSTGSARSVAAPASRRSASCSSMGRAVLRMARAGSEATICVRPASRRPSPRPPPQIPSSAGPLAAVSNGRSRRSGVSRLNTCMSTSAASTTSSHTPITCPMAAMPAP